MRIVLLVDGNNFYHRTLWGCFKPKKNSKVLKSTNEVDIFEKALFKNFASLINEYKSTIYDIVFISDSRSWRKDVIATSSYKANRALISTFDNDGFSRAVNNFENVLNSLNVKISKAKKCEGDDLLFGWAIHYRGKGYSVIIHSVDKDTSQLVDGDKNSFTIQISPIANIVYMTKKVHEELFEQKDSTEFIFELEDYCLTNLKTLITRNNNISIVNPESVRFKKVISGDSGDNVSCVCKKPTSTGKFIGIGDATAGKIYEKIVSKLNDDITYKYYFDNDGTNILANIIAEQMKGTEDSIETICENINTNCKLVVLSKDTIPNDVLENMNKNIDEVSTKKIVLNNLTKEKIFGASRFGVQASNSVINIQASKFKGITEDNSLSFINDDK